MTNIEGKVTARAMNIAAEKLSDQELISHITEGDHRYFSVLSDRYGKYIYEKCKEFMKNDAVSEDLSQEVMIRVFLQLPNYRGEAKFTTWLYTIIHNICIDFLRKQKKNLNNTVTEKLSNDFFEMVDFDEEITPQKTMEILEDLLEELTPQEKLILLLKYKEKHHLKDITLILGITESALKMRLKRAKEKLNKLYDQKLKK